MADPLSILGGVAASIQLAECATAAFLGTIKLIREIRDVPKKTARRVDDVERSTERLNYICRHILGAGSPSAEHVDTELLHRLSTGCDNLRLAIDEAKACLDPLVEATRPGGRATALRLWNAMVSTTRETAILEKLQRIQKHSLELIEELNIVSFVTQTRIGSALTQTTSMIQNGQSDCMESLSLLRQSNSSLEASNSSIEASLDTAGSQISHISSGVNHLSNTADLLHSRTLNLGSDMQSEFRMTRERMEGLAHIQESAMSDGLRSLRDELMLAIAGIESRAATSSNLKLLGYGSNHLELKERVLLRDSMAVSLMRQPTAMRDAWYRSACPQQRPQACLCRPRTTYRTLGVWNLRLGSTRKFEHRDSCPLNVSGPHMWNYSLTTTFRPFLNAVMEISIGAATGIGVWTMLPPLKLSQTIQRSQSAMFSAFDSLFDTCAQKVEHERGSLRFSPFPYPKIDDVENLTTGISISWNDCTARKLTELSQQLRHEIEQRRFHGREVDESGFNIFYEFCNLLVLLGQRWKSFEPQLGAILDVILESDVDLQSRALVNDRLRHYGIQIEGQTWSSAYRTAFEYLLHLGNCKRALFGPEIPFYNRLEDRDIMPGFQRHENDESREGFYPCGLRSLPVDLLTNHVEVAEALEYDDLALAILNRSIKDVQQLTSKACYSSITESFHTQRLTYTELAVGWPEGIEHLIAKGYTAAPAISLACRSGDEASLERLLKSREAIFKLSLDPRRLAVTRSSLWVIREAIASRNREMLGMAVSALRERRERLHAIAFEVLSEVDLKERRITRDSFFNRSAASALLHLRGKAFIPPELDCCDMASPYHFIIDSELDNTTSSLQTFEEIFQTIHDYGFTEIDEVDDTGETPMFRHIRWWYNEDNGKRAEKTALWFLRHGANVMNQAERGWPNILFYLALYGARNGAKALFSSPVDTQRRDEFQPALVDLQTDTDSCNCHCSSNGCLPLRLLGCCHGVPAHGHGCVHEYCLHSIGRFELLQRWIQKWNILEFQQEIMFREMSRLELFDRLGMAHTCCLYSWSEDEDTNPSTLVVKRLPESEISLMQGDDCELNSQLSSLMTYYDLWRQHVHDSLDTFYNIWWKAVDEILPPLTTDDCHLRRKESSSGNEVSREQRERETLRRSGFGDFEDFQDIIDIHFSRERFAVSGNSPLSKQDSKE